MEEQKAPERARKEYSNPYQSLEAVWYVLRKYSSRRHPLTVKEIWEHLQQLADHPSKATLNRLLPGGLELMEALFPGMPCREGEEPAGAYGDGHGLHVVLEAADGRTLAEGEGGAEYTVRPFTPPSYSSLDKLLDGLPLHLKTFPYKLRCVARVPGAQPVKYVPYDRWADHAEAKGLRNNNPRRYYLESALTPGEWRVFSDLVQVYPFISEAQTARFLRVLDRMQLGDPDRRPAPVTRYAVKRSSPAWSRVINCLDRAIQTRRMVHLTYGEYVLKLVERRWTPVLQQRRSAGELTVAPYALIWSNGYYYLVCRHRGMMNLRVDRILSAELTAETFELPADFDPVHYRDQSPMMHPGDPIYVRMRCKTTLLNKLLDHFGALPQYSAPAGDGATDVRLFTSPSGVKLFALQYADSVEVLEPAELRREILQALEGAAERYRSAPQI